MARPRKLSDAQLQRLENLAANFCTISEIAADLDITPRSIERYADYVILLEKGKEKGKLSIRAQQFRKAMGTPGQDAIYLRTHQTADGKQYGELVLDKNGRPIKIRSELKPTGPDTTMLIWLGKQQLGQSDRFSLAEGGFEGFGFSFQGSK